MTEDEAAAAVSTKWVRQLMRACGIRVEVFGDGTTGLVDVPARYCAAIDAMHRGLAAALAGEELPKIIPPEPKRAKGRKAT